jgi:hypothetical protein
VADGGDGSSNLIAMRISFRPDGSPAGVEEMVPIQELGDMMEEGSVSHEDVMGGLQEADEGQIVIAVEGDHDGHSHSNMQANFEWPPLQCFFHL